MTLESAIADELRPVIRKNIDQARAALDDARRLLFLPVRKASSRPFLTHIKAAEQHYREQVLAGLNFGLDPEKVARAWARKAMPVTKADLPDGAATKGAAQLYASALPTDSVALQAALGALYAEGYVIGAKEALTLLGNAGASTNMSVLAAKAEAINWDQWTPGNPGAAAELAGLDGGAGLGSLLDSASVTIKSIQQTQLDQLAGVLADGAQKGDSVDTMAASIRDMLTNSSRAEMIASTELNRSVTTSTLDTYQQNGIEQFDVLVFAPCDICSGEADSNPHDLSDDAPPYHPSCECAAAPHIGDAQ